MAEIPVNFLLERIVPLLEQKVTLLKGVREEVGYIREELQSMRTFLRVADSKIDGDDQLKDWVNQVRDVAYDTEDVLDQFLLRLAQHSGHGSFAFLRKIVHNIKTLKARHQIATAIQAIKTRVEVISSRRQRYLHYSQEQGSSSNTNNNRWHDPRGDALLLEEAELVGIGKPRDELIELLTREESRLEGIAVVGMGGLGKTTLVKKVFDNPRVKGWFKYQTWTTVSQTFKIEELLRDMIGQLFKARLQPALQGLDTMKEIDLKGALKELLQLERYLVVFDDVWSMHDWEDLKYVLPDNSSGSRVMVTTRFTNIATKCGHVYPLDPLGPEEAWTLFCKKAFQSNPKNSCPQQLEELSLNILRKCNGLPLAIVAIGGLLATKDQTQMEWEIIHRSLGVELESGEELKSLKNILLLSYNDLPYYLKSCFLYLSIYPEDYSFERMRLIRSWIAEGFIKENEGMSLTTEEIAERCLIELINRSLIQVVEKDVSGRVRRCQIHDFMRDLLVSKSREGNFALIVSKQNTSLNEKARRLSIHNSGENALKDVCFPTLRSLFIFEIDDFSNSSVLHNCFSGFRLLKVLDLEGAPLDRFPSGIENMLHLKYLSLRSTKVKELPKSLGRLHNLETLDLKHTHVSELPEEIVKLRQLRHLLVYRYNEEPHVHIENVQGFKMLECIGGLTALQKLAYVDVSNGTGIIRELGKLIHLRRLGIRWLRREDGPVVCASIEKMGHLVSLNVSSSNEDEILDLRLLASPPPLQRLCMEGHLEELPNWCPSLHNLVIISLRWSKLKVDPTQVLCALPNLVKLELLEAYDGEQLNFLAGGFQRLKILRLVKLEGLKLVKVDAGAMPKLQDLHIRRCGALEKVPLGTEGLTNLKILHFFDMPPEFVTSIFPDEGEDYWRVQHIPDVFLTYWTDEGWEDYRLH